MINNDFFFFFKLWMFTFMTHFEDLMKYADEKAFNLPLHVYS